MLVATSVATTRVATVTATLVLMRCALKACTARRASHLRPQRPTHASCRAASACLWPAPLILRSPSATLSTQAPCRAARATVVMSGGATSCRHRRLARLPMLAGLRAAPFRRSGCQCSRLQACTPLLSTRMARPTRHLQPCRRRPRCRRRRRLEKDGAADAAASSSGYPPRHRRCRRPHRPVPTRW